MGDVTKAFEILDWGNGFLFLAALLIIGALLMQKSSFIIERLGIVTKRQLREEEQENNIKKLKEHAEKTDENIDKILVGMNELKTSVQDLTKKVDDLQTKNDMNEAAHLKDRIAQSYQIFKERGEWTMMDKEAMEDMIHAYSQYSENSFVHSIVEKNIPLFKIIDE